MQVRHLVLLILLVYFPYMLYVPLHLCHHVNSMQYPIDFSEDFFFSHRVWATQVDGPQIPVLGFIIQVDRVFQSLSQIKQTILINPCLGKVDVN